MFKFIRNGHTVFQSDGSNLHSYQQRLRFLAPPLLRGVTLLDSTQCLPALAGGNTNCEFYKLFSHFLSQSYFLESLAEFHLRHVQITL